MRTDINRGFEVFVPSKTLDYERRNKIKTRFWIGADLQIAVPIDEEPNWDAITSAFEKMLKDIKEVKSMAESATPNEFINFCDQKRKNFLAPPTKRIYEY